MIANYKGFTLVERADGSVDACCVKTGGWINRPTLRCAKWAVSVYVNIQTQLVESRIQDNTLQIARTGVMHSTSIQTH